MVLEHLTGIDKSYRFWTTNTRSEEELKVSHDEHGNKIVAYKPVWFTDSKDEAIFRCSEGLSETQVNSCAHHMLKMQKVMIISQLREINELLGLPIYDIKDCG